MIFHRKSKPRNENALAGVSLLTCTLYSITISQPDDQLAEVMRGAKKVGK
jgi:hypothetical protein